MPLKLLDRIGLLLDIKVRFLTSTLDVDVGTVGLLGTETLCLLWTRTRVSSWKACTLTTCILFNNSSRQQHDNDIIIVGLLMTPSVRRRCRRRCRRRRCSDDDAAEADANADAKSRMMDIIICCNLTSRIGQPM